MSGVLSDDDQVTSTNQYAAFHRINPATVAKAFQGLVDDGLLYKRRGVGMFVSPGAADRLRTERRGDFIDRLVRPLVREALHLGLTSDDVTAAVRDAFTSESTPEAPGSTP